MPSGGALPPRSALTQHLRCGPQRCGERSRGERSRGERSRGDRDPRPASLGGAVCNAAKEAQYEAQAHAQSGANDEEGRVRTKTSTARRARYEAFRAPRLHARAPSATAAQHSAPSPAAPPAASQPSPGHQRLTAVVCGADSTWWNHPCQCARGAQPPTGGGLRPPGRGAQRQKALAARLGNEERVSRGERHRLPRRLVPRDRVQPCRRGSCIAPAPAIGPSCLRSLRTLCRPGLALFRQTRAALPPRRSCRPAKARAMGHKT